MAGWDSGGVVLGWDSGGVALGWDSAGGVVLGCRQQQGPSTLGSLETANPWKQRFTAPSQLICQSNPSLEIMQKCFKQIIWGSSNSKVGFFFYFPVPIFSVSALLCAFEK